jgi:Zn-dependent peptidase ImmA (M78 family)
MFNKVRINLDEKISSSTKFKDLLEFSYCVLDQYDSSSFPVDLNQYIEKRKIVEIQIDSHSTHRAFIEQIGTNFKLTLKENIDVNIPRHRYLLAHEIAHTFQFELKSNSIIDKFFFSNGSKEQEYFCDFLARAILIPSDSIKNKFISLGNTFNSLKIINQLIKFYNVEYNQLLFRILNDLSLFKNIIILRFILFKGYNEWKLFESFKSENINYNKEYFIPSKNYNLQLKYQERFPSCGDGLNVFLTNLMKGLKPNEEVRVSIEKELLENKPIKAIGKKIISQKIDILVSMSIDKKYDTKKINILVDLTN